MLRTRSPIVARCLTSVAPAAPAPRAPRAGSRAPLALLVVFAPLVALAAIACGDETGPSPRGPTLLVTSGEPPALTAVDGSTGHVTRQIAFPAPPLAAARSPDRSLLYIAAGDLVAIDTRSLEARWREPLSTTMSPRLDRWGGVRVTGDRAIAVSPDNARLFIASAFRGDTQGVALLDAASRNLVGFAGPFFVEPHGLVVVPPGATAPEGALLVVGQRGFDPAAPRDWLYTLDLTTLAVRDSTGSWMCPKGSSDSSPRRSSRRIGGTSTSSSRSGPRDSLNRPAEGESASR